MLEDKIKISLPVIKVTQPIGDFYIGAMKARDLYQISKFDIRKIQYEDGIENYLGIQRELNDKRVDEIQNYTRTVDATFPSAVILAVEERSATIQQWPGCEHSDQPDRAIKNDDSSEGSGPFFKLTLQNSPNPSDEGDPILLKKVATVLDGQHRIAGLENYPDSDFLVNVAIFVGLDLPMQANIFSVVNLAQTKVNPSLVYDLFAYDKARSPEKTAHEVAVALDITSGSPFYKMIKRLGTATKGRFGETLSQATFVKSLIPYLSENVMLDRDIGRRGKRWPEPTGPEARRMIFRKHFVEGRDADIAATIWAYFDAVAERWPEAWNARGGGMILNKTTGYQAFAKFLGPAYREFAQPGNVVKKEQFASLLRDVKLADNQFTTDEFKPGSSGTAKLLNKLLHDTGLQTK